MTSPYPWAIIGRHPANLRHPFWVIEAVSFPRSFRALFQSSNLPLQFGQFGAQSNQHSALDIKLLPRDQIKPGESRLQHSPKITPKVFPQDPTSSRHPAGQFL
jgi:hypothetical protein